jgi:hypothetical protein
MSMIIIRCKGFIVLGLVARKCYNHEVQKFSRKPQGRDVQGSDQSIPWEQTWTFPGIFYLPDLRQSRSAKKI